MVTVERLRLSFRCLPTTHRHLTQQHHLLHSTTQLNQDLRAGKQLRHPRAYTPRKVRARTPGNWGRSPYHEEKRRGERLLTKTRCRLKNLATATCSLESEAWGEHATFLRSPRSDTQKSFTTISFRDTPTTHQHKNRYTPHSTKPHTKRNPYQYGGVVWRRHTPGRGSGQGWAPAGRSGGVRARFERTRTLPGPQSPAGIVTAGRGSTATGRDCGTAGRASPRCGGGGA